MKNWVCFVLLVTEVNSAYVKRQSQGCIYEGRAYQQGETWQKSCELNCVCQDASSGRYQCNSICPTYSDLPPSCILVKASGECCAKPQCNFQPAGQSSFTGTGTGTGSGSGSVPVPGSCSDQIQTCSSYGTSVCSDQSYAKWVENNCCAYCRSNTGGTGTMTGGTGTLTGGTGTMTGGTGPLTGGTGTMTGSGSGGTSFGPGTYPVPQAGTPTGGSCSDQIQTCSSYGTSVCSDQSYAKWVENNCCAYCRSNTGGTGTMTGGTGTMTGGAGTMTGGTGPLTGGTGTMTGSGSGSCTDKLPNCNTFGKGACSNPTYSQWVTDNCALYCGKCGGTMMGPSTGTITGTMTGPGTGSVGTGVMPGTGTGTMAGTGGTSTGTGMYPNPQPGNSGTGMGTGTGGYCADKLSNCNTYGTGVCSNPTYSKWVTDNCALYCGKCGGTLMAPTTGTFMGPGTGTTTGTGIMTGTGSCTDKISNCNSYGTGVCSNPAYSQWVTENCGLYCGKCGPLIGPTTGAMTGPGTGSVGTGVMPGTGTGSLTGTGGTSTGTGMYPGQHPGNSGTGMGTGTGGTMTGTGTGYPVPQAGSGTGTGAGASCTDKISNCDTYGKSVCSNPTYSQWVTENCGLYCGKCGGTMTGPTTGPLAGMGTGTMTGTGTGSVGTGVMPGTGTGTGTMAGTGGCMDKTTNCAQLDQMQHICSNTGARIYAQTNCPLTCNLCPSTSCADKITNCAAYGSSVCTDATYSGWVTENCAKSCNKCSGAVMSGNGPMTGGTGPMTGGTGAGTGGMTGHLSGCVYNTQVYQQGQSWNDGCTLKCTCSDGSSGQYTCTALCVSWQLPSACTLSPPAPGKCCTTPNCPAGFSIQYPPGYQEN